MSTYKKDDLRFSTLVNTNVSTGKSKKVFFLSFRCDWWCITFAKSSQPSLESCAFVGQRRCIWDGISAKI